MQTRMPAVAGRPVSAWALSRRKRAFDIFAAAVGLIVLCPVMALVALLVRRKLGSPALFVQHRPGRQARPFRIRKYRSMTNQAGPDGQLLAPEQRLTPFGRWLRSTSLDELPELWNVLVGDMSLVGPRPLRMEYSSHYNPEQARRLLLRPGITGLAQVGGRNLLSWEAKFEADVCYVDGASLAGDLRILASTLVRVVSRKGVETAASGLSEPFAGVRLDE